MAENDQLFALLEIMLRTFAGVSVPRMKPGGHSDEIFVDLTDDKRENLDYQILKDVRQCENKHKFCYSCIFVWSTSGNPTNHSRCPVCRVEGLYVKNERLNNEILDLPVKCHMLTCRWKGQLREYEDHVHTTYGETANKGKLNSHRELPVVNSGPEIAANPPSTSRLRARSSSNASSSTIASNNDTADTSVGPRRSTRPPLTAVTNNGHHNRSNTVSQRSPATAQGVIKTSRSRSRSRVGNTSPQRRTSTTSTGLPSNGRLTSRARIRNGGLQNANSQNTIRHNHYTSTQETSNEHNNSTVQTTTEEIHTPRPPTTPRPAPASQTSGRRLPTLPSIVSADMARQNVLESPRDRNLDNNNNNNVSQSMYSSDYATREAERRHVAERRHYVPDPVGRNLQTRSFGTIRERLNESRQRLDMLMSTFSSEIDRGRQNLSAFQQEREVRRQEQMSEVRDLGRRLTHVASELRGLLNQRRQIRQQIDTMTDAASEDTD
ncbi:hypothetical protein MAR_011479 [Mya arenaria]|uniref:Uncharacterized protein n=1 Tax=Mya arenaria TaxID=6604 RepID=A0ABY7FUB0_MYAAR|nr:hypothetical protein MAR_011479 [Mya arenaria]